MDITYPNALAPNGKIVNVSDPEFQDRNLTFSCLGCGEPMVAVHRTKGKSHFRHLNSNPSCNPQTYLHRLAKALIKQKFDSPLPFYVTYKADIVCSLFRICVFKNQSESLNCAKDGINTLDLHTLYDTCQEEVKYNGYIADLLLTNSKNPKVKPLFLEVAVTHKCDEEKINSGISIIELDIQEEKDILCPIIESGDTRKGIKPASFYNFDRTVVGKELFGGARLMKSAVVQGYGVTSLTQEYGGCRKILGMTRRYHIFEAYFLQEDAEKIPADDMKRLTWARLFSNNIRGHVCAFCARSRKKTNVTGEYSEIPNCKTPPKIGMYNTNNCKDFVYEDYFRREILDKYKTVSCMSRMLKTIK